MSAIPLPPASCLLPTAKAAAGWRFVVALILSCATGCGWMAQSDNINGVSLYQQGNYQSAINQFTQAVEADPMDADSYYNLGSTYHHLGKITHSPANLQQAESYYHQCLDRNPDQRDCYRGLAVLLVEEGRGTDAFSLMQQWVQHSPASPEPRIELARLYEEFGDKASATSNLQEVLALQPTNARALAALGKLKEDQGDSAGCWPSINGRSRPIPISRRYRPASLRSKAAASPRRRPTARGWWPCRQPRRCGN